MPKSALILCNGLPPPRSLAARIARGVDLVVAADGGATTAKKLGMNPDLIIGDLDSITPATRRWFRFTPIMHVPNQDTTDLEKALEECLKRGVRSAVVLGADGGRIDFTLANLSAIWNHFRAMRLCVAGDGWYAVPVRGRRVLRAREGTTVSLIPNGPCSGVTLRGLVYPLVRGRLNVGDVAVSNVVKRSPFSVTVVRGSVLVVILENLSLTSGLAS